MAEVDSSKINIRLHIYDLEISTKVPREDEALYRKGGALINELLNAYYAKFKGLRSDKEISYYAMIDLAVRLGHELERNDTKPYDDILLKLTSEIETELGEK